MLQWSGVGVGGSAVAGGPSEHCGRCRDSERVWRRCEGLRCRAAWRRRSLWRFAAPPSQGVRVLGWMDGWVRVRSACGGGPIPPKERWKHLLKTRWKVKMMPLLLFYVKTCRFFC